MAEEDFPIPVMAEAAEVETVEDDGADGASNTETAMETTRAQAEARRKRVLEKANTRMKYVNGEQIQDEEEKKTSRSNAARIRAARARRYGKKSAAASAAAAEPSAAAEASTSTSAPDTEPEKVEPEIEPTTSPEDTTSSATAAEPKKKYVGVAKMRRKLLAKKKMEEENNDPGASSTASSESAKAALAADGKASKGNIAASTTSVGKSLLPPVKVQTIPIYMHMIVILLLFVSGFDVGIQQFHADVDVRTQMAVHEHGVPFLHRNPWQPLKPITTGKDPKEALKETLLSSSSSHSSAGDLQDEFGEVIDEEYVPPNIDPIFRTDLDDLTKGPGFIKLMARGAISIHRLILWIFYYAPMGLLFSILSIPTAIVQSPPGLFLLAVVLRQVVGKGVLGAAIPQASGDDGADGTKSKNNIEVLSMAKNFVKNFFTTRFPTLVTLYDVYLHLKADMYVVLCGVFFGLAWTHLGSDAALSCDADAIVGASEGEL
jgi:hypothetical protein